MTDIARHVELSNKIDIGDLDWAEARRVGLTDEERDILTYFADVEGQTVFYMVEVLKLKAARDPETVTFATLWNYEEFYHSHAIARLLGECGHPLEPDRLTRVRLGARLQARVEDLVQRTLARLFPRSFVALWMAWGASQELLTLRGYEQIARRTRNPVLRELCLRIARQERRHFAWYYGCARARLGGSPFTQKLVRKVFELAWSPVGVGVKSKEDAARLIAQLFPGDSLARVTRGIDHKMAALPGMDGFAVTTGFAERIQPLLPLAARALRPAPSEP